MRIQLKGGVWKNTEDEILKAAVMKYGKTQWARISSLLVRKTPKQCKTRWYEWLDPSIKKTEWSKEEDEKLLHLAKLMPTQWRTIAPLVGRAPAQCLERYQKLLDEAESRAAGEEEDDLGLQGDAAAGASSSGHDARRLRPGEIDPNTESKPARPDPVDMDEDEKDMLSEARARLANTMGKKAKRKAREHQLEEARRLATLQKRRELKAAGVDIKAKKPKKNKAHMDYNREIPYAKQPMPGFYDTTKELQKEDGGKSSLKGKFLDKLQMKSRSEREEDARNEAKRKRDKDSSGVAFVRSSAADQRANDAIAAREEEEQSAKRSKLILPAPQVTDQELEAISKISQRGELARELVMADEFGSTDGLLGEYAETTSLLAATRTPNTTTVQANQIMDEALEQRMRASQATPLMQNAGGGEDVTVEGALARKDNNKLAISSAQLPDSTPAIRDQLGLNTPGSLPGKATNRGLREQLARKLASLPKPKNEYEIVMPEVKDTSLRQLPKTKGAGDGFVEDQADVERRMEQMRLEEAERKLQRRSQCVRRGLPRPNLLPAGRDDELATSTDSTISNIVLDLINKEMRAVILNDARVHPVADVPPLRSIDPADDSQLEGIPDNLLQEAKSLIEEEMSQISEDIKKGYQKLGDINSDVWLEAENSMVWLPQNKSYARKEDVSEQELVEKYKMELAQRRDLMAAEAARAAKIEKKLSVTLGGYQGRAKTLSEKINKAYKEFEQAKLDTEAFGMLYAAEQAAIPARIEKIQTELLAVETRERNLQSEYQERLQHR